MHQATIRRKVAEVVHVSVVCVRAFEVVRDALLQEVPSLNPALVQILTSGDAAEIAACRAAGPELWLFETRDHGALVVGGGRVRKAIQFEIGNPLTAERMTRRSLGAALYAPLRVLLYEDETGQAIFLYDLPSSLFGLFDDAEVTSTAHELDAELQDVLMKAAG